MKLAKPLKRARYQVGGSSTSVPEGDGGTPVTAIDLQVESVRLSTYAGLVSPKTSIEPGFDTARFYAEGEKVKVPDLNQIWIYSSARELGALEMFVFIGPGVLKLVTANYRLREFELPEGVYQLIRSRPNEHMDIRLGEVIQIQRVSTDGVSTDGAE